MSIMDIGILSGFRPTNESLRNVSSLFGWYAIFHLLKTGFTTAIVVTTVLPFSSNLIQNNLIERSD